MGFFLYSAHMIAHIYILYSSKINKFYIGQTTLDPLLRLNQHNNILFDNAFTSKGIPWELFLSFSCTNVTHARRVEAHIKKMKSSKYIHNLKAFPEMRDRLINRFSHL